MAQATVAEEEYLQTMSWLQEAGLPINGANIARAMQLSPPTVHEMIGRLEGDGYVERADDKSLTFTERGRGEAQAIVRRHRLIERFLTDVLGIPWDEVHEEAERLEHAMSPVLEERMYAAIAGAETCPHGHPIVAGARLAGVPLADVEVGAAVRILRFENEGGELLPAVLVGGGGHGHPREVGPLGCEELRLGDVRAQGARQGGGALGQRAADRLDRALDRPRGAELEHDRLRDHAGRDVGVGRQ